MPKLTINNNQPVLAIIAPDSLPIPPVQGGSIQTIIYDYLRQLSGFNIFVFSRRTKGVSEFETDQYGINHVRIKSEPYHNLEIIWQGQFLFRFNFYIRKIGRYLRQIKPGVVHVYNRPHFVPIIKKYLPAETKIVLTNQNAKIGEDQYVLKKGRNIFDLVDKFIYPSRRITELDLLNNYPEYKPKTSVIYNSVDLDLFRKVNLETIKQVRDKLRLGKSKVLLFVGRLVQEKGIDKLLEAMGLILREEKETKLLIVGTSFFAEAKETPFIKKLKQLAEPIKENIIFTGFISNDRLPEIYSAADIFVSPVVWEEPFGKVFAEAGACECAVIASHIGGIPEILENGESALLLDLPYEVKDLADTVISLLRDPETRLSLGKNARIKMEKTFDIKNIGRQWQKAYQELL